MNLIMVAVSLVLLVTAVVEARYYHHGYAGYDLQDYHGKEEVETTAVGEAKSQPGSYHQRYSLSYGQGYGDGYYGSYAKNMADTEAEYGQGHPHSDGGCL